MTCAERIDNALRSMAEAVAEHLRRRALFVFLAGRQPESGEGVSSLRDVLRGALERSGVPRPPIEVWYPEHVFTRLVAQSRHHDLLGLEQWLARSVDGVVLVLEEGALGALAELGAFASSTELAPKVIAVNDKRYQHDRSFINLGPLRRLEAAWKQSYPEWPAWLPRGPVLWEDLDGLRRNPRRVATEIHWSVDRLARARPSRDQDVANLVTCAHICRYIVYCEEGATWERVARHVGVARGVDDVVAEQATRAACDWLIERKELEQGPGHYVALTDAGVSRVLQGLRYPKADARLRRSVDTLRQEVMNALLRRRGGGTISLRGPASA